MTVFSANEERFAEANVLHANMHFDMPQALGVAGGDVFNGPDFEPNVIVDRELITGQNPSSDHQLGAKLIDALRRAAATT
jgi:putative intracellular protease/amidase